MARHLLSRPVLQSKHTLLTLLALPLRSLSLQDLRSWLRALRTMLSHSLPFDLHRLCRQGEHGEVLSFLVMHPSLRLAPVTSRVSPLLLTANTVATSLMTTLESCPTFESGTVVLIFPLEVSSKTPETRLTVSHSVVSDPEQHLSSVRLPTTLMMVLSSLEELSTDATYLQSSWETTRSIPTRVTRASSSLSTLWSARMASMLLRWTRS
mmetsp:Transcript_24802/g.39134  ORF Transcript_24802/g.39134 Transcript_24802/m.39134 type:complete len:209 (-) Transcript_24802:1495-2121(-)